MKKYVIPMVGCVTACSEIWKQWMLTTKIYNGTYCVWYVPFQLCSVAMYLCLIYPFVREKGQQVILTFLMDYSLLGGICAFLDTSGMHYSIEAVTIHSYVWHLVMIGLGIYAGYEMKKEHSSLFLQATAIYGICCVIATGLNLLLEPLGEINMFYINLHHPMDQRIFHQIAEKTNVNVAVFVYICATITGAYILHRGHSRCKKGTGRIKETA